MGRPEFGEAALGVGGGRGKKKPRGGEKKKKPEWKGKRDLAKIVERWDPPALGGN